MVRQVEIGMSPLLLLKLIFKNVISLYGQVASQPGISAQQPETRIGPFPLAGAEHACALSRGGKEVARIVPICSSMFCSLISVPSPGLV